MDADAFLTITVLVISIGALAYSLAVVGALIFIGIDMFKKATRKGVK
jgi:hypothetical protein